MQAKYTVVLKTLMDNPDSAKALDTALSTYPLYKRENTENTIIPDRAELNKRLLNFYKYREIGFETVGRFLDELENVMCEIMPYYNEMFKTVEIMSNLEDPFANVDVTETTKETRDGTATNTANTTTNNDTVSQTKIVSSDSSNTDSIVENTSKNTHADTPQNDLSTIQAKDIDSVNYASDITWNKSDSISGADTTSNGESTSNLDSTQETISDTTGTTTTKDTIEHTYHKKGNQGVNTYAHDMNEFRTTIIDITNKIINDSRIAELFMMVF